VFLIQRKRFPNPAHTVDSIGNAAGRSGSVPQLKSLKQQIVWIYLPEREGCQCENVRQCRRLAIEATIQL
jgi:hypothetical protein